MTRATMLIALGCTAGCATVYEGKYDWDKGWRSGRVTSLGALSADAELCRRDAAPGDAARARYAEVQYHSEGRWQRNRVVAIPEGMDIREGQRVYLNLRSCELAKAATAP